MLNIEEWMNHYTKRLLDEFQDRIIFIGLQGSYGRNEATEDSDIDVVAIFDYVTIDDLRKYDAVISELPERDKICGFVSGKAEIMHWEKSDLFQFYYDTQACYGDMDFILPLFQKEHVRQAVLIGSCNIYHACCHNIIHEKSPEILQGLYKQSVFVLQAKYFYDTGVYIKTKRELMNSVSNADQQIIEAYLAVKNMGTMDADGFLIYSDRLFVWAGKLIESYSFQN